MFVNPDAPLLPSGFRIVPFDSGLVPWYWYILLGFIDVQANFLCGSAPLLGGALVIAGTLGYALITVGEVINHLVLKLSHRLSLVRVHWICLRTPVGGSGKFRSHMISFQKPKCQSTKVADKLHEQRKMNENKCQEERVFRLRVEDQLLNTQNMVTELEEMLANFMKNFKV